VIPTSLRNAIAEWEPETRRAVALSLSFFVLTLAFGLVYTQRDDAPAHILRSQWILTHGWFPYDEYAFNQGFPYVYPPMFHILGAVSKLLTGTYLDVPAFSGAVSVFLTYRLVSYWHGRSLGLSTAKVLAVCPIFVLWSARMYTGTLVAATFLLTMVLYFAYRDRGDRRYLYAAFIVGGSLSAVKTYGPIAAGIVLFHLLWTHRDTLVETVRSVALPLSAGVLASLPWPIRNVLVTGSPVPKVTGYRAIAETGGPSVTGIHLFLPSWLNIRLFLARALGVVPPELTTEQLGGLHPLLPILWLALPLSIIAVMVYGARGTRTDPIVWIWIGTFCLLYVVQRFMSGGATGFKYRHFITLTPLFCLLFTLGYRRIQLDVGRKRLLGILLAVLLLTQMGGAAALQTVHTQTAWEPATDWVEQNVDHDEVIYYQTVPRNFAYRVDPAYKFITTSGKDGYIHPSENFTEVIGDRADWVIINDNANSAERARIRHATNAGSLRRVEVLNATREISLGETSLATIGRTWYIYEVVGGNTATEPLNSTQARSTLRNPITDRNLGLGSPS